MDSKIQEFWVLWQELYPVYKKIYPSMNSEFYSQSIFDETNKGIDLLVSGAADEDTLKVISSAGLNAGREIDITLVDFDKRAIERNVKYIGEHDLQVNVVQEDILTYEPDKIYDVVVSDGFLDYFNHKEKKEVLSKWASLIHDKGRVVTTIPVEKTMPIPLDAYGYSIVALRSLRNGQSVKENLVKYSRLRKLLTAIKEETGRNSGFESLDQLKEMCNQVGLLVHYLKQFNTSYCPSWNWYNTVLTKG